MTQSRTVLAELDERRRRARAASAAGWLPLLLTGAALLGSFPAYAGWWDDWLSGCNCVVSGGTLAVRLNSRLGELGGGSRPVALYWLVIVPGVYAVSLCWFVLFRRRTGLRRRWGLHFAVGAGALLALGLTLLPPLHDSISRSSTRLLLTPLLALGLGLVALGRVERDWVIGWSGASTCAIAVTTAVLRGHYSRLPDTLWGDVGQSLLAPSVDVAGVGFALVVASLLTRRARSASTRTSAALA
jgi:hypothetical protein